MKSDIILEDYKIKAISNHADFEVNHLVIKGNKTEINSDKVEIDSYEFSIPKQGIEMQRGQLHLGDQHAQVNKHVIRVYSEKGSSSIHSNRIQTEKVSAKEINTKNLLIGLSPDDNPKPGNIEILNKQGEVAVTIDGEKEDILLKSIGSLMGKIKDLEKRVARLEGYHPRVIRSL